MFAACFSLRLCVKGPLAAVTCLRVPTWKDVKPLFPFVAPLTGCSVGDVEDHGHTPMAGATGFPVGHLFHGETATPHTGGGDLTMAVGAAITTVHMDLVAELHIGRTFGEGGEAHRPGHRVTLIAAPFHGEGGAPIVTGATAFSLFHLRHGRLAGACCSGEESGMTVGAAVHPQVQFVAEGGARFFEGHLLHRMAFVTATSYCEGGFAVMTGATARPLGHLGHGVALGRHAGGEDTVMTVAAFVHTGVDLVAKGGDTGGSSAERDFIHCNMAFITTAAHGKGGAPVVTGATAPSLCHFRHGVPIVARSGHEDAAMAIATTVHGQMLGMAELPMVLKSDILHGVTAAAVGDGEGRFAVVTGATTLPFLHISHAVTFGSCTSYKYLIMAVAAAEHAGVEGMAEIDLTRILNGKGDFTGGSVTLVAIAGYFKGAAPVVTGAATSSRLHLSHGYPLGTGATGEKSRVAISATIGLEVKLMAELCIHGLEVHLGHFTGVTLGAVASDTKGNFGIMTGAATGALDHLLHGVTPTSSGG